VAEFKEMLLYHTEVLSKPKKDVSNYGKRLDPFSNPVPTGKLRHVKFFSIMRGLQDGIERTRERDGSQQGKKNKEGNKGDGKR
jgi:hypothetical protein